MLLFLLLVLQEELDLTSTFVSKARLKVGPKPLLPPLLRKAKVASSGGKELAVEVQQEVRNVPFGCGPFDKRASPPLDIRCQRCVDRPADPPPPRLLQPRSLHCASQLPLFCPAGLAKSMGG